MTIPTGTRLAHERADLADGLNRPDLVVGQHQRDENCVWPERCLDVFCADYPIFINGKASDFPASFSRASQMPRTLECSIWDVMM